MNASRARFLSFAMTTCQGASVWLVRRNISSRALLYSRHL